MLKSTVVGNYPKLPSQKGDLNIRRTLHRFDKKEISREELETAFDQVTARVVREQVSAGIDLPTDGQIRWDDIVTPLASKAEGFQIGGLLRWFDNNVYYRKPQITSAIRWKQPVIAPQFKLAMAEAGKPIKAVLPAPFSFALLSEDKYYKKSEKLIADLVALLREEVKTLIDAGAKQIQFDEPWLQYRPEEIDVAVNALNAVVKGFSAEFWICFYFGKLSGIASRLKDFNVQVIAADCVSFPGNLDLLMQNADGKNLCFGLLDARNIKLESESELQKQYAKIATKFPSAYISPSCGLEFLPHESAVDKINLLSRSVKQFNGAK